MSEGKWWNIKDGKTTLILQADPGSLSPFAPDARIILRDERRSLAVSLTPERCAALAAALMRFTKDGEAAATAPLRAHVGSREPFE